MLQFSSSFYFCIPLFSVSHIHVSFFSTLSTPRYFSCTLKVMLPNITVLLHSYMLVLSPHA